MPPFLYVTKKIGGNLAHVSIRESYAHVIQLGRVSSFFLWVVLACIILPNLISLAYYIPTRLAPDWFTSWTQCFAVLNRQAIQEPSIWFTLRYGIALKDLASVFEVAIGLNLALSIIDSFSDYIREQANSILSFYRDPSFLDAFNAVIDENNHTKDESGLEIKKQPETFEHWFRQQLDKEDAQFNKACSGLTRQT
jgi:hypothetical protein